MTERDEFAKIAMGGLASGLRPGNDYSLLPLARQAYAIADAMLQARDEIDNEQEENT